MKRVHYIDNYLLNPQHPVTVNLILSLIHISEPTRH